MPQAIRAMLPEPRFQCAGVDFGAAALAAIHFRTDDGGHYPPSELHYAELVERETETECRGFYCERCLAAFGKKTGKRQNLLKVIESQMQEQQRKSLDQLRRITGYRP